MAIKVKFISGRPRTDRRLYQRFLNYTPGRAGRWKGLRVVQETRRADWFVVLNRGAVKEANRRNTIVLQREPTGYTKLKADHVFTYENSFHWCAWLLDMSVDYLDAMQVPAKRWAVATVVSDKKSLAGHRARLQLLQNLQVLMPVEAMGKGVGTTYRLTSSERDGLFLTHSHILSLESAAIENYFTEKIVDAFLCWARPIYWGCPNIYRYFPPESLCCVDVESPTAVDQVREDMQRPVDYEALREARNLILYEYNILNKLYEILA